MSCRAGAAPFFTAPAKKGGSGSTTLVVTGAGYAMNFEEVFIKIVYRGKTFSLTKSFFKHSIQKIMALEEIFSQLSL